MSVGSQGSHRAEERKHKYDIEEADTNSVAVDWTCRCWCKFMIPNICTRVYVCPQAHHVHMCAHVSLYVKCVYVNPGFVC